jgi:glutamine cyclotransferase
LFFSGGYLYESAGLYGQSALYRLDAETGRILAAVSFPGVFAEGGAALNGDIHVLTWQDGVRFLLREEPLRREAALPFSGEGWGLCSDGEALWLSDGSAKLRKIFPQKDGAWLELETLRIVEQGRPVSNLNELEWVEGFLLANVWQSSSIAVIDPRAKIPESGDCPVLLWLDCQALIPPQVRHDSDAVLNGIAWDAEKRRLLVTGKRWPVLYELELPYD